MSAKPLRHEIEAVLLPVLLYAVFASLWILFSDQILAWLIRDPEGLVLGSTLKGLGFVGVTTLLLYRLLDRQRRTRQSLADTEALRLAQEEHLKALHLMAAIANSSQDPIFAQDREGRFILFNKAAERVTGKTADQVLGLGEAAIFPPEMAARLIEDNRAVLATGLAREFEETLAFPGGERTVWTTKGPLFDQAGRVVGLFGISRDITAQQQAARALRESEERLRLLIDHAPVALALFDRDMRYLAVSRRWREDFELGEREVLGLSHYEVFPDLPEKWKEAHRRGLAGETVSSDGEPFERRDGTTLWSRWEVLPWRDVGNNDGGEIGGILILAENITERKQAEVALQESEGRFRALVEQTLAGIYIIQDGRFRYVNPGFAAMFGYASAAEIIERLPVAELVMPEDRARVAENVRQRVEGQVDDIHYTFAGRRRNGARIEVEVHGRRFDYQGRPAVIGLLLDITARKAAEDALRESELRFHDIVNASADWIWEVDAQGRYTYASESVRDLLGYEPGELLGKTPFDLMPVGEADAVAAQFAACVASKVQFRDLENINLRKDGQKIHVASNGMPILDGDGQLLGYRGLDRDITERKASEKALRDAHERLRTLIDTLPDLVWLKDTEGVYLACNRRFEAFFGAHEAEILGKTDYDFVPREQADFFRANDQAALTAGAPSINEEEVTFASDGHRETLHTIKTPLRDSEGRLLGVLGIARDISERKKAETSLRESETRLKGFFDNVESIMWIKDREGRFLLVNQYLVNLLGRPREDIIGRTVVDLFSLSEADAYTDHDRLVLSTARPHVFEETAMLQGGLHYFMSIKFPLQDGDGSVYGIGAICTDITAMKNTETELKERNDELERFNRASIGRELDMLEMKKTINALSRQLGRDAPYPLAFLSHEDGEEAKP